MALEDTAATIALVAATLVLAYVTRYLYKATNVLAQIESKRDRRSGLTQRIRLGESLATMNATLITDYLSSEVARAQPQVSQAAAWVRTLRTFLPKDQDPALRNLVFSLDYLIMNMDNVVGGATDTSGVETEVLKHLEIIKGHLRNNLLPKWRTELETLEALYDL